MLKQNQVIQSNNESFFNEEEVKAIMKGCRRKVDIVINGLETTASDCHNIGLPVKLAKFVAKVAVKKCLDENVKELLKHVKEYRKMVENSKKMWEDPSKYYLKNKGHPKFPRFGSLSYSYSEASLYRLVQYLLEDSKKIASSIKTARLFCRFDGDRFTESDKTDEYCNFSFERERYSKIEQALMQDIKSTGIDPEIIMTLKNKIGFDEMTELGGDTSREMGNYSNKLDFLNAFFVFFSLPCGDEFLEKWKIEENRVEIIKDFITRYNNEPEINPALIGETPASIGNRNFQKKCEAFYDTTVNKADGTTFKRRDLKLKPKDTTL